MLTILESQYNFEGSPKSFIELVNVYNMGGDLSCTKCYRLLRKRKIKSGGTV